MCALRAGALSPWIGPWKTLPLPLATAALAPFVRVTVPLALPALVGGAVLSWARALGEFGATIMFAGNLMGITQTMPLAVYLNLENGDLDSAVSLSVVLVLVSLVVSLVVRLIGD